MISTKPLKNIFITLIIYMVIITASFIFLFPLYYVAVIATNTNSSVFADVPPFSIGPNLVNNFLQLLHKVPIGIYFINSTAISVLSVATKVFFCTLTGFVLAKYKFKGRNLIFGLILFTLSTPKFLLLIPLFNMMIWLKWINTYLPLIVPSMADGLGIFLMTQIIEKSVPDALLDSARVDGFSEYQIAFRIGFPLARPGIAVLGTVAFIASWNDFMFALVMLPSRHMHTIPVAIASLMNTAEKDFSVMMMATGVAILPLILVFLFFSRQIISNLLAGSVKG
ncbi:MAG: carbohydrate ABC transporter permease [Spirochaetales bacterium]|nr:carbohydrate ABC transporter permease [Spirochaetales bacterium]